MSKPRVCYAEHNRAPRNLSPTRGFGGGGAKPRPARGLLDQHHRDRLLPERLSPAIDERDPAYVAIKGLRGLGKLEGQPLLLALLEREQGGHLAAGNRAEPGTNVGLGLVPPTDPKLRARRQSRERHAPETGSVEPSGTPGDPPEPRHHQKPLERFRTFRRTASSPFLNLIRLDRKENRFSRRSRSIAAKDPTRLASGKIRPARPGRRSGGAGQTSSGNGSSHKTDESRQRCRVSQARTLRVLSQGVG